ncbi:MAG: SLATT domain-containing protein, partial [Gallionellaceae bacterium]
MNEGDYLEHRLNSQIEWYDNKSGWNQAWHKKLRFLEILAASSIPFLTGYITDSTPDRGCKKFCVNGHLAGNCLTSKGSEYDRSKKSSIAGFNRATTGWLPEP